MTSFLDLSLPSTVPNTKRHHATLKHKYKFAVYTIVDLEQAKLQAMENELNSAGLTDNTCKLASHPFPGHSLRDVFNYHIRLRDEDTTFHPLYFIVAANLDYKTNGLVVVHLNTPRDDDEDRVPQPRGEDQVDQSYREDQVSQSRCPVDRAASWGINIDIGNEDWEDLKEEEERIYGGIPTVPRAPPPAQPARPPSTGGTAAGAPSTTTPAVSTLDDLLDPGWLLKPGGQRRVYPAGNFARYSDPWAKISAKFPVFCKRYPTVHRRVAICVDERDFESDGVLLVRYDWDGDVDVRDDSQIGRLGLVGQTVKRVPASRAVAELDQYCRAQGLPLAVDWEA